MQVCTQWCVLFDIGGELAKEDIRGNSASLHYGYDIKCSWLAEGWT